MHSRLAGACAAGFATTARTGFLAFFDGAFAFGSAISRSALIFKDSRSRIGKSILRTRKKRAKTRHQFGRTTCL